MDRFDELADRILARHQAEHDRSLRDLIAEEARKALADEIRKLSRPASRKASGGEAA